LSTTGSLVAFPTTFNNTKGCGRLGTWYEKLAVYYVALYAIDMRNANYRRELRQSAGVRLRHRPKTIESGHRQVDTWQDVKTNLLMFEGMGLKYRVVNGVTPRNGKKCWLQWFTHGLMRKSGCTAESVNEERGDDHRCFWPFGIRLER
jgi:hypothetical protein